MEKMQCECTCSVRKKQMPRNKEEQKSLLNRLSRLQGQIGGVRKMIEEDRYCGDILIQIAAIEKALEKVGLTILRTHMETCVKEDLQNGNVTSLNEAILLIERLK